jgi:outer membrane biosynthesis protein TonB
LKLVALVSFVLREDRRVTPMGTWFKNSAIPKLRRDLLTVGKAATDETERKQMDETSGLHSRKLHMLKNQFYRSLVAVVMTATLWSVSAQSQATELRPIVVVGTPAESVATRHPTPEYPRDALNLHISGNVLVTVRIENGKVMETTATSHSSILADSASRWVGNQWKFKPSVSGVFTIPIFYKQSA